MSYFHTCELNLQHKIKFLPFYQELKKFVELMSKFGEFRLVGGCVRDIILDKIPQDIDLNTNLKPKEVMRHAKNFGFIAIPTGIQHGTITVMLSQNFGIEITTLRHDIECYGRKAKVDFTTDFYEDALRRDFTINALSYCILQNKLFDYFNGLEHLYNKQVVFIGDSNARICEDYLRILRFFRFSCYYGEKLDEAGYSACLKYSSNLQNLSYERITGELNKTFSCLDKLNYILPLIKPVLIHLDCLVVANVADFFTNQTSDDILNILHTISQQENFSTKQLYLYVYPIILKNLNLLKRFKFSNYDIDAINLNRKIWFSYFNINEKATENTGECLNNKIQLPQFYELIMSNASSAVVLEISFRLLKILSKTSYSFVDIVDLCAKFPINGRDIMEFGFKGNEIGKIIKFLRQKWIESNFQLVKSDLMALIEIK